MYSFICILLFSVVFKERCCFDLQGWNYINLHCRNNRNKPVDWWFMYKPPSDVVPGYYTGRNFSFISSDIESKWLSYNKHIDSMTMLQHTLSPLFRPTYKDHLAAVIYNEDIANKEPVSSTHAILMADEIGGLLLLHTIPGFPDMNWDRLTFPEDQLDFGHLIGCVSLDLKSLNDITALVRATMPQISHFQLPTRLAAKLPDWQNINQPVASELPFSSAPLDPLEFLSQQKLLRIVMLGRRPADIRCLYKEFAKQQHVVLDVYRHDKQKYPFCDKKSGVRNIDSISMKHFERVHYIDNTTDRANFAVSTAAHWQRRGSNTAQYWTCISTVQSHDVTKGGFIVCIEDYRIWWNFDNLKVKEPDC